MAKFLAWATVVGCRVLLGHLKDWRPSCWLGDGEDHVAHRWSVSSSWEGPLSGNQPGSGIPSPTTARLWILPTKRMSLEVGTWQRDRKSDFQTVNRKMGPLESHLSCCCQGSNKDLVWGQRGEGDLLNEWVCSGEDGGCRIVNNVVELPGLSFPEVINQYFLSKGRGEKTNKQTNNKPLCISSWQGSLDLWKEKEDGDFDPGRLHGSWELGVAVAWGVYMTSERPSCSGGGLSLPGPFSLHPALLFWG